jgi:hypothetical protein
MKKLPIMKQIIFFEPLPYTYHDATHALGGLGLLPSTDNLLRNFVRSEHASSTAKEMLSAFETLLNEDMLSTEVETINGEPTDTSNQSILDLVASTSRLLDEGIALHQNNIKLAQRNYYYRVMRMLFLDAIPDEKTLPDELKTSFKQCLQRMQTLLHLISPDDFDYETFLDAVDLFVDEILLLKIPLTPGVNLKEKQAEACRIVKDYIEANVELPPTIASFRKSGMHALATAFTRAASDLDTLDHVQVYIADNSYFEIDNFWGPSRASDTKFSFKTQECPPLHDQIIDIYIGAFENGVDIDSPQFKFNDINAWVRHQLILREEKKGAPEQKKPLILVIDNTMSVMDDTYLPWLLHEFKEAIEQGTLGIIIAQSLNKYFSMGTDKTPLGLISSYSKQEAFPALTHLSEDEEETGLLAGMQPDSPSIALATSIMQHENGLINEKIDLASERVRMIQSEVLDASLSNTNKMVFVGSHLNKASYDHHEFEGMLSHAWTFISFSINRLGLGESDKVISVPIYHGMKELFSIAGISNRDGFGLSETVMTQLEGRDEVSSIFRVSLGTESEAYHRAVFSIVNDCLLQINELFDINKERWALLFDKKSDHSSKHLSELKKSYLDETQEQLAALFFTASQKM